MLKLAHSEINTIYSRYVGMQRSNDMALAKTYLYWKRIFFICSCNLKVIKSLSSRFHILQTCHRRATTDKEETFSVDAKTC
jgi:hypothetical protein